MKRKGAIVLLGLILAVLTVRGYAAFEDTGTTARGRAMGNAIFADFDAVNSMSYNPATISMARSIQSYFAWDTPYWGLNDETGINTVNFNLVVPFWNRFTIPPDPFVTKRAALGISVHRLAVGGTDVDGSSVEFYHEGIYSLTYAKDLNDALKGAKLSAGVKASLYDIGVGKTIDVQNNDNFSGKLGNMSFGLDVGMTYDFSEAIHLGLVYKNLVQPNISIMPDGKDYLPAELRFGGNVDFGDLFFLKKSKVGFGIVTYGRDPSDNRQSDMEWDLGYEFRQLTAEELIKGSAFKGEMLAVRVGGSYMAKKVGDEMNLGIVKLKGVVNLTAGLGFTYVFNLAHQVNVDYTFEYGINMGAIQHSVALTYRYLLPNSAFAYRDETRKELEFEELIKQRLQNKEKADASATNAQQGNQNQNTQNNTEVQKPAAAPAEQSPETKSTSKSTQQKK